MSFLKSASFASICRGYEYFKENKVKAFEKIDETHYMGLVVGSGNNFYIATIDLKHPKKSKCDCPHAEGRLVICKHKVALYFAVFPDEAENFYKELLWCEEEAEQYEDMLREKVIRYVNHMKKAELQQALIDILFSGPEWQYDHFVRFYDIDDD